MKLHGTDIDEIRRQVRRFYKTMFYADRSVTGQLGFCDDAFDKYLRLFREEYTNAFGGLPTEEEAAAKFNQSDIANYTTTLEPVLCQLALTDNKAGELHTQVDSWGGFDMTDMLSGEARQLADMVWHNFNVVNGMDLRTAYRMRKFSIYEVANSDVIEEMSKPVDFKDYSFFKALLPEHDLNMLECPAVYVQTLRGIHRCKLNVRDQVRGICEYDANVGFTIGICATERGAAELNRELEPHRIKFLPKRQQSHYGATLQ